MEKFLNEGNIWVQEVACDVKECPECLVTREEVVSALRKMRNGRAASQSGVVNVKLRAAGEVEVDWLTDLCNSAVISERKIPADQQYSNDNSKRLTVLLNDMQAYAVNHSKCCFSKMLLQSDKYDASGQISENNITTYKVIEQLNVIFISKTWLSWFLNQQGLYVLLFCTVVVL